MNKYDLSDYQAVANAAPLARERANDEPNQESYNAGWLHGYADALAEVTKQQSRTAQIFSDILGYLAELWDDSKLYDVLHNSIGISNAEITALDFNLADKYEDEDAEVEYGHLL